MLEVKNLHVSYGMIDAVKGIDFQVNDGEIVSLIGANGAGKTTTMHTLSGLLKAKEGQILLDGKDLTKVRLSAWVWYRFQREDVFLPRCRLKRTFSLVLI